MPLDVSFACPDWWERLQQGLMPFPDLPLDKIEAQVAVDLLDKLRIPDIPGQPSFGEAGGDWVRVIARAAFGSIDPETGERFVGEIFNLVPKKNGKTTNSAALGILWLLMNNRPNVDGVIIGPTQEVADKCFAQASAMIAADEYLSSRLKVDDYKKTITDLHLADGLEVPMNAKLKIKSFDPKVVTGSIPAFAVLDELHVMAESHHADRVIRQIRGGMITNPESLLIIITTQSEIRPQGVFKAELEYARKVRDGLITEDVRMLPVLYEFPLAMQADEAKPWRDPKKWAPVLPNLGRSISVDRLVKLFKQEAGKGSDAETGFFSQHLNIQIGTGHGGDGWAGSDFWRPAQSETRLSLEELLARCEVAVIGVDGGGLDDLLGFAIIGRERDTGRWLAWVRAWVHRVVLQERRKSLAPLLEDLAAEGDLVICDHPTQDIEEIVDLCLQVRDTGLLPEKRAVGMDPASSIVAVVDAIEGAGIDPEQIVPVSQGFRLTGAVKGTERRLFDGTLKHQGQPLLDWCVSNARVEPKGNAVIVTKAASGVGKIDPLMALFNAVTLMSWNPVASSQGMTPWERDPNYRMAG